MRHSVCVSLVLGIGLAVLSSAASAQSDPPGRIGRLAYMQGTVSFHAAQQDAWSPAAINHPITTGDALWTEPNGHGEIQIGGTRVRMDGHTQLDVLALDDTETRLQLDQGRLDVTATRLDRPYQIMTPRGMVMIEQQGDYYIHGGSADDPTVLGVRAGAARIEIPNGQALAVQAGEQGQVIGNGEALQLRLVHQAPPAMPAFWAERDRVIRDAPPQYLSADVTGYEDLAQYGTWAVDGEYGEVWYPSAVPVGWQPYSIGYWTYVGPWGWTWVDSEPWGFAPYHYGRWTHLRGRWCWIPPQRDVRPIYAPALVAFVGGAELGAAVGLQSQAPVGWFPLGPREPYVPSYVADPNYYRRINAGDRVERAVLDDRWQRVERHEALHAGEHETWMNRRFATIVPAADFAHSRPVQQAALRIPADKLASVPVAPVAAPPTPGREPNTRPPATAGLPTAPTAFSHMEQIGRSGPGAPQHAAPGPRIVEHTNGANRRLDLPPLPPRASVAPQTAAPVHPPATQPPAAPQIGRGEPQHPEASHALPHPEMQRPAPPPATGAPPAGHPQAQRVQPQPQHPGETHAPTIQSSPPTPRPVRPQPPPQHPTENRVVPPVSQPPHQAEAPRAQPQHPPPPPQFHAPASPPRMHAPTPPPAPHPPAPPQQAQTSHPSPQGEHEQKKQ